MNREQAVKYLSFSGFSDEQIKAIEGAFTCEDAISRKAVLNTLENMDKALDEDRTVENYKDLLRECYKVLPSVKPRSEWEHDHEILKAYSDGVNDVLDEIKADIEQEYKVESEHPYGQGLSRALEIIDRYKAESEVQE